MNIELTDVPEQHLLVVGISTQIANLPNVMGPTFNQVLDYAAQHNIPLAGLALTRVVAFDPAAGDIALQVGFPIQAAAPSHSQGPVAYLHVPPLRALRGDYVGHYGGLAGAHQAMKGALQERQLVQNNILWEHYVRGPETTQDYTQWLTQIYIPVA